MEDTKETSRSKPRGGAGNPNFHKLPGAGYLPSGDKVKADLTVAKATAEQIDITLRFLNWGRAQKITSVSSLAKRLNVSSSTIGRLFRGEYGADIGSIIQKIEHFLGVQAERVLARAPLAVRTVVGSVRADTPVAALPALPGAYPDTTGTVLAPPQP